MTGILYIGDAVFLSVRISPACKGLYGMLNPFAYIIPLNLHTLFLANELPHFIKIKLLALNHSASRWNQGSRRSADSRFRVLPTCGGKLTVHEQPKGKLIPSISPMRNAAPSFSQSPVSSTAPVLYGKTPRHRFPLLFH